jgi:hypothetical protein
MTKVFPFDLLRLPRCENSPPKKKKKNSAINPLNQSFSFQFCDIENVAIFFSKKLGRIYTRNIFKVQKLANWVVKEVTKICWKKKFTESQR